jgi:hypothetical protein
MKAEKATHPNPRTRANSESLTPSLAQRMPGVRRIELNLRDLEQLFNTMDPSPFHEKDLDHDAEEFILSWAQEFHHQEPIELVVHLEKISGREDATQLVTDAVHNYFAYRARLNDLEFDLSFPADLLSIVDEHVSDRRAARKLGLDPLLVTREQIRVIRNFLSKQGEKATFLDPRTVLAGYLLILSAPSTPVEFKTKQ